jgi:addiction module RelE/StbE family toxin
MKRNIRWDNRFKRAFQKTTRKHPELLEAILEVIELLSENPFHKTIDTHKLKGDLEGYWPYTVEYDCRIVFKFSYQ